MILPSEEKWLVPSPLASNLQWNKGWFLSWWCTEGISLSSSTHRYFILKSSQDFCLRLNLRNQNSSLKRIKRNQFWTQSQINIRNAAEHLPTHHLTMRALNSFPDVLRTCESRQPWLSGPRKYDPCGIPSVLKSSTQQMNQVSLLFCTEISLASDPLMIPNICHLSFFSPLGISTQCGLRVPQKFVMTKIGYFSECCFSSYIHCPIHCATNYKTWVILDSSSSSFIPYIVSKNQC